MTLALLGGSPVITTKFKPFQTVSKGDAKAVYELVRSGLLSGYVGYAGPEFMGGPEVRRLETEVAEYFGVKHCLALNSWTSGLQAAVGALALEPGSEVIVSPWTMAASATCVLSWNCVPRFADIDPISFNLNLESIQAVTSERTRAIVIPDIFGQSAEIEPILRFAEAKGLLVISDSAQSPGVKRHGKFAGTFATIGGFSLNRHKHMQSGEGGLLVTDDDDLALRVALLRNHGEVLVGEGVLPTPAHGVVGGNLRMCEVEALIARRQLPHLAERVQTRETAAEALSRALVDLPGLTPPSVSPGNSHAYYIYAITIDETLLDVPTHRLHHALVAEGVPALRLGYQNIHKLPLFRDPRTYGVRGSSHRAGWTFDQCPVAEDLNARVLTLGMCAHEFSQNEIQGVVSAFEKVWHHLDALRV